VSSGLWNTGKATLFWRRKDFADLRRRSRRRKIDIQSRLKVVGDVSSREVRLRKFDGRIISNTCRLTMEPVSAFKMIRKAVVGIGKPMGSLVIV